jgi:hypothetical protein
VAPHCCRWRRCWHLQRPPLTRGMRRSAGRLLLPAPWLQGPRAGALCRPTHRQPLANLRHSTHLRPGAAVAQLWPAAIGHGHNTEQQTICKPPARILA